MVKSCVAKSSSFMSKTMVWSFSALMFKALNASGTPLSKIWKSDTWALSGWLIGLFNVKAIWLAFSVRAVRTPCPPHQRGCL